MSPTGAADREEEEQKQEKEEEEGATMAGIEASECGGRGYGSDVVLGRLAAPPFLML